MDHLTPLEIQKQTFGRGFRGYTPDEVRAYLHLVAEEVERLLKEVERLTRENSFMREQIGENSERENILKETLMSAQKVSEDVVASGKKEAELIVKDAELLSERIVSQAMSRMADLERAIQDLKLERKAARNKLASTIDTFQQMILLDAEQEANEMPITQLYKKTSLESR
jgi:cell division initiation protein